MSISSHIKTCLDFLKKHSCGSFYGSAVLLPLIVFTFDIEKSSVTYQSTVVQLCSYTFYLFTSFVLGLVFFFSMIFETVKAADDFLKSDISFSRRRSFVLVILRLAIMAVSLISFWVLVLFIVVCGIFSLEYPIFVNWVFYVFVISFAVLVLLVITQKIYYRKWKK